MPYISVDDYLTLYGERETTLITAKNAGDPFDSAAVDAQIAKAEEEANGYIGKRYTIPLASPPALVTGIVSSLARWYLFKNNRPQTVIDDAEVARKQLLLIAKGELTIPSADGVIPEQDSSRPSFGTSGDGPAPVFTEANLAGFNIPVGAPLACWRR